MLPPTLLPPTSPSHAASNRPPTQKTSSPPAGFSNLELGSGEIEVGCGTDLFAPVLRVLRHPATGSVASADERLLFVRPSFPPATRRGPGCCTAPRSKGPSSMHPGQVVANVFPSDGDSTDEKTVPLLYVVQQFRLPTAGRLLLFGCALSGSRLGSTT